ncbi:protein mono-ADP-ribosyltransferase PARP6-like [Anneissia japonica]|uniref:protein mono-ADP-ribosyltransferase PARP6-like n=1 Tax=Anneissia japonica TaxID=1529436 RepID=UPI001425BACB|nr:protein mono-ADP-ribosyltransferase PARP6-like [Anneissia japonica]
MDDLSYRCYTGKDESRAPLLLAEQKRNDDGQTAADECRSCLLPTEKETHQHFQQIDGIHYIVDGDDGGYDFRQGTCLKDCVNIHKQNNRNDGAINIDTDDIDFEGDLCSCAHSTCSNADSNGSQYINEKPNGSTHKQCDRYTSASKESEHIIEQLSVLTNHIDANEDVIEEECGYFGDEEKDSGSEDDDYEDCQDYYQYSDDHYDDDEDDAYEDEVLEETALHSLLSHDIHSVKLWYGPSTIDVRRFSSLDDVDVDLKLDISFLHSEIASAWSLLSDQPLVVRLNFSSSRYLDGDIPKVTVFQPTKEKQVGICVQVRKITEGFVSKHWKVYSNSYVESKQKPLASTTPKSVDCSGNKKFKNSSLCVDDTSLSQIMELGYSRTMATNALVMSEGSVTTAISFLQSNPARCQNFQGEEFIPRKKSLKTLFRQKSSSKNNSTDIHNPDELHLLPTLTEAGKSAKTVPSLCHGFLNQIFTYLRNRISSLNEYCVVCDEPHIFQNGYMLKPAVCERELCVFAFQTLGVMRNAAEDIAMGAEVVDLLVAMVAAAIKSKRKNLILDPYPMVVDPFNPKEFAFSPKKKDCAGFQKIEKALESFISIREMLATGDPADMKKRMDIKDPNSYPLLQWIVSSNRSHIVKLPESRQIKFMHTPHQFLLMTSPPSKEAIFSKAKQESGSVFAFHGSHIENWHSILRKGLINASGTKYQLHGAAYGQGIYLSPHSSVSFGYSGMGHGFHRDPHRTIHVTNKKSDCRFLKSKNLTCIALCEVIESKELKKNGNIWVCTNPDHVCTRFFFRYEDGKVGDLTVDTSQDRYSKEILVATQVKTHPKTGKNILA